MCLYFFPLPSRAPLKKLTLHEHDHLFSTTPPLAPLLLLPPNPPSAAASTHSNPGHPLPGAGGHGMEVRSQQTVDKLFRGGRYHAPALQHHPSTQERVLPLPLVLQEVLWPDEGGEEGAHEDDKGE